MPHYNVMGVAKAALESDVRYLAADLGGAGHPRQRDLGRADQDAGGAAASAISATSCAGTSYNSPLERNVTHRGGRRRRGVSAQSDLGRGVTGEVHHVDCGYHIVGMKNPAAPDIYGRRAGLEP